MTDTPEADAGRIAVRRIDGTILAIGLDRPAKRNGFTPEMAAQLAQAYTELENDPALRVGVLYAEGAHFSGGIDLPRWAPSMQRGEDMFPPGTIDPLSLREPRRTKPVVCAVQGWCWTIGVELMLAADIVVSATDARFAQLEVLRGVMATGGGTLRIAERAGLGNAMLYLLTGDGWDAQDAYRMGLVQKLVAPGEQFDDALAIARRIAAAAPLAVRATLANARLSSERGPQAAIAEFGAVQSALARSADAAEGVAAFRERRAPRFTGR
ncbi:MAG TPA: crotonase/enoyl-CoA hydratase family protein [Burkholderiaceae bacterium]|nr:crotonase/enoyl-CoA hydratase family protein [Burkholderiaceae bacterium]